MAASGHERRSALTVAPHIPSLGGWRHLQTTATRSSPFTTTGIDHRL
jgi:hypothetical protein